MNLYKLGLLSLALMTFMSSSVQAKSDSDKKMYDLRVDISVMEEKLHTMGVDVNINEVPSFGSQYLQDQALRSQYSKLQKMMDQLNR
jgi:hypothetical protein